MTRIHRWPATLLTLALLVACGGQQVAENAPSATDALNTDCEDGFRLFEPENLATDPICIPESSERIIAMDLSVLQTLLSVGVTPVGATQNAVEQFATSFEPLAETVTGISEVGDISEPNFEAMLALEPDLIVGSGFLEEFYDNLSAIAPTVLIESNGSYEWKAHTSAQADAAGRLSVYEEQLDIYNARTDELDVAVQHDPSISLLRVSPDSLTMYTNVSFPGTVLEDSGLRQVESQTFTVEEALQLPVAPHVVGISLEEINQVDGDYVFVFQRSNQDTEQNLQTLQDSPLWGMLEAVQNDRVFTTDRTWSASGIHMAHFMLDGLFETLVGESAATPNPFLEK